MRLLPSQHLLRLMGNHGHDQRVLVREVVIELGAAHARGCLHVVEARARDAIPEHQLCGGADDALPRRASLGGEGLVVAQQSSHGNE